MNESLSSGLNPPPTPHFSPFSLFVCPLPYSCLLWLFLLLFCPFSSCSDVLSLPVFLYFSVISHSFLSLSERSFLSQLSAQKLYGGTSWLQAKTLLSDSFSLSVMVSSNHSICPPSLPDSPFSTSLFVFPPPLSFL